MLDLNHVVTDVEQLLRRTIGEDVVLRTDLAADLWPVLADAGQIEQVLVNLAVNARDAMTDGGTLSIDTANVVVDDPGGGSPPRAGRHVRLRVSDTGTGMPADVIEHIFEPFFTTKADGAGTGLGLATVYGIVAQAGGHHHDPLAARSRHHVHDPAAGHRRGRPARSRKRRPIQRTPTGETVLIVEDEDALREVTERIFTRSGYRVHHRRQRRRGHPSPPQHDGDIHLLLTDVVMPNMLGKEVAERIRTIKPDIEVLYMSGYAQPVLASQADSTPTSTSSRSPSPHQPSSKKPDATQQSDQGTPHSQPADTRPN